MDWPVATGYVILSAVLALAAYDVAVTLKSGNRSFAEDREVVCCRTRCR